MNQFAKTIFVITAFCAAFSISTPLAAEAIEEKRLLRGQYELDADQGYIFVQSRSRFGGTFVRVPDEEDLAEYKAELDEEISDAQEKHLKRMKRRRGEATPFDPSQIAIEPIELRLATRFGPEKVFTKADDKFTYLTKVKPGRYIWYGNVVLNGDGKTMLGHCLCMGTIQFEVKAGTVTDLGNSLEALPDYPSQETASPSEIAMPGTWSVSFVELPTEPLAVRYGLPETLSSLASFQPEFYAVGKMNNFYGIIVSRLPPVDGVLGYDRDTVIDLRTGEALQSRSVGQ